MAFSHAIGYANGFKAKKVKSRIGELNLSVPQVRDSTFYPSVLERGLRSERALMLAIAEMYVQGASTRKVKAIKTKFTPVNEHFEAVFLTQDWQNMDVS